MPERLFLQKRDVLFNDVQLAALLAPEACSSASYRHSRQMVMITTSTSKAMPVQNFLTLDQVEKLQSALREANYLMCENEF